jgi:hypothetical protein
MPCASSAVMRPRSTASFTTSSMRSRVSITRLSGRITPRVIASRTSATDLPEKSSRSAVCPAAEPAFCAVPAALPARRRPAVERVWAALRPPLLRVEEELRDVPPERELLDREPPERELEDREVLEPELEDRDEEERLELPPEREEEPPERDELPEREPLDRDDPPDREPELDEREPPEPDDPDRDEPEPDRDEPEPDRDDEERDPDDDEREPDERPPDRPLDDPPPLPLDDSAMTSPPRQPCK